VGYAILRHGKIKGSGKGVCTAHNRRLAGEQKENIDSSLTPLNEYSGDAKIVDRINAKLPEKRRKDAVEAVEILLTASPEFFDDLETDRTKLASHPTFLKWKAATVAWAKKELGGNLVDLALHLDEKSPHIHAIFVPLIDGRLCAKEVTSRQEMVRRQTSYAKSMTAFGLVRGDPASETHRKHVGLKDKPSASGGQLVKDQAEEIEHLQAELAKVQAKFERQKTVNGEYFAEIRALKRQLAALQRDLNASPTREPAQTPKIDPEAARSALLDEFKPVRMATNKGKDSEEALGKVVGWTDGLAILHLGRGVYVQAPLLPGAKPVVGQTLKGRDRGQESGIG
jgi:hypothetical protein